MFDWVIYKPAKIVKVRWSKSLRLFQRVAFLLFIQSNVAIDKCQIDTNEWLLLSAFQQGLRQNLSWFLPQYRKMLFLIGFILKPTERTYRFF